MSTISSDEPKAVKLLRGPLSKRATSAEFNEWQAREVVAYIDSLLSLRESHPIEDGEGWRDISTAPKDGTELILLFDGGVWSGRWVQDEGWFETNNHPTDSWGFGELRPTMWRHYPAAPSNPGTSKVENSRST